MSEVGTVALIEWRDQFRIGIAEVDHEHEELVRLINALHEACARDGTSASLGAFLGELHAQIAAHFALEEKVMLRRRYAGYADHKLDHERLLDEIREIMDDAELAGHYDAASLGSVLETWFGEHFRTHDARLHHALAS
jgi:hemerythrin